MGAQPSQNRNATASLSTVWTNSDASDNVVFFWDESSALPILQADIYSCGFYCSDRYKYNFGHCFFAVLILPCCGLAASQLNDLYPMDQVCYPRVVWSTKRNSPVKFNSMLELRSDGDLAMKDADGTTAWSSNTSGKSVAGMSLMESGNLMLLDKNNETVWESFDHPTDSLVMGQKLVVGKKLVSSASPSTDLTLPGLPSLSMTEEGLSARLENNPAQVYYDTRRTDLFYSTSNP
ncbi:hypothetical protein CDL15_Pgr002925 [Punica granatum]|uniref:Bulb-type lectin domain-containing protein n=1 Tax=Punica granatum TaxID=22663 RepID=A0A218X1D5_PUNGR|nr:hypothetical protein CDL15_Pgr002925 [Punica granatum]PKI33617.1 hypothetical protein CRG98_045973 [Punica granatum]